MPESFTGAYYHSHYAPIQHAKYAQLWPAIQTLLQSLAPQSLLDVGIGPAWLETFFQAQGLHIPKIVGTDVSEEAITPRKEGVEYILPPNTLPAASQFDLVVCFDAWHCFPELDLASFVKPQGLLLVSEPLTYESQLSKLKGKRLVDVVVGEVEKSRVVLVEI